MSVNLNSLAQILDTTWGRSSTTSVTTMSIKMRVMNEENIQAIFFTIVNFSAEREMFEMKKIYEQESTKLIKQALTNVKKKYEELEGHKITLKEVGTPEFVIEMTGANPYNPKRTCIFKRISTVEFS